MSTSKTITLLKNSLTPFPSLTSLPPLLNTFSAKILLLGDASHGTSEFYAARAAITKHMIIHHGVNIVAWEADWPDADAVDRYVRHRGPPATPDVDPIDVPIDKSDGETGKAGREPSFSRFPTWMWRNTETRDFVEWLREYNRGKDKHEAVGVYGLDLYSLSGSMHAVIEYLDGQDPELAKMARERYGRLMVWAEDPEEYGFEVGRMRLKSFEREVVGMLKSMLERRLELERRGGDGVEYHSAEQNARLVVDAEKYYKTLYSSLFFGRDESWNLRDTHMFETLDRVLQHRGKKAKAVVWAHNSHIGDARATDMGWSRDELNIGQLCKEKYGDQALAIGCGTYTGSVAAAHGWGGDMHVISIRPGLRGSIEELMHSTGERRFVLDLRKGVCDEKVRQALMEHRLERFIGVIYSPETERQSHYSKVVLPEQFDGFIWFDETNPVSTSEVHQPKNRDAVDETWPFAL